MTESTILRRVMRALSYAGVITFRNNVGALIDREGRTVRYGVCNPGGSDLIGWRTVRVTPRMVGDDIAVFLACEVKAPDGRTTPAQENFLRVVREAGGIAILARSPEQAIAALKGE